MRLRVPIPRLSVKFDDKSDPTTESRGQLTIAMLSGFALGGLLLVYLFLSSLREGKAVFLVSAPGTALMASAGSFAVGSLIGFLFGIPRTLQRDTPTATPLGEGQAKVANAPKLATDTIYRGNTNLEQISDWLTKIMVGVGLVELRQVGSRLRQVADVVAAGIGATPSAEPFALGLIVYFIVSGFFIGYLWSRLELPRALIQSDQLAAQVGDLDKRMAESETELAKIKRQDALNARALAAAAHQLEPDPDALGSSQAELNKIIGAASSPIKVHIFYRAEDARVVNWREDKQKMAHTIPLFRALIASDPTRRFHRNFGQLGYALKDLPEPQWQEALDALSTAIDIRRDALEKGYRLYEFNRAVCEVNVDADFAASRPSTPDARSRIVGDLAIACGRKSVRRWALDNDRIASWLSINKLSLADDGIRDVSNQRTISTYQ